KGGFAVRAGAKFDQIGDAGNVQARAGKRQRRDPAHAAALARTRLMGHVVQDTPLGGEAVLRPNALDMDECGLAQARRRAGARRWGWGASRGSTNLFIHSLGDPY